MRAKINDIFKDKLSQQEINDLAALVYYPEEKLKLVKNNFDSIGTLNIWYITTIQRLIDLHIAHQNIHVQNYAKHYLNNTFILLKSYFLQTMNFIIKSLIMKTLVNQIIELEQSDDLIIGLSYTVQRLVVDQCVSSMTVVLNLIKLWIH